LGHETPPSKWVNKKEISYTMRIWREAFVIILAYWVDDFGAGIKLPRSGLVHHKTRSLESTLRFILIPQGRSIQIH